MYGNIYCLPDMKSLVCWCNEIRLEFNGSGFMTMHSGFVVKTHGSVESVHHSFGFLLCTPPHTLHTSLSFVIPALSVSFDLKAKLDKIAL